MQLIDAMTRGQRASFLVFGLGLTMLAPVSSAAAELAVSQLIVELDPRSRTTDVEIFNDSDERTFISVEAREIVGPGTPNEKTSVIADPEALGLLVSPRRMVLEPRQRRSLRIAKVGSSIPAERVYRVLVKPVVGEVSGSQSGLKLLVGYDLLVLARPGSGKADVQVAKSSSELVLTNHGNVSVELTDGRHCDTDGANCAPLPGKRLYAGAAWRQSLPATGTGSYRVRSVTGWSKLEF